MATIRGRTNVGEKRRAREGTSEAQVEEGHASRERIVNILRRPVRESIARSYSR